MRVARFYPRSTGAVPATTISAPSTIGTVALGVGIAWLALTLAFEFSLGYFVSHLTWREMLAEYDLASGRLWVLVPVWVAVAPYVFYTLQEHR
jgi:hypothetical protein